MIGKSFAMAVIAVCCISSAAGQNNQLLQQERDEYNGLTGAEMAQIYQSLGFITEQSVEEGLTTISATTPDGEGVFYTAMLECGGDHCKTIQLYALFNSQGVTFNQLNDLHLNQMNASTLMLLESGEGLIVRKIYFESGISAGNFGFQIGLFMGDINRLLASITPGTIASVELDKIQLTSGGVKTTLNQAAFSEAIVNQVGLRAPSFVTPAVEKILNGDPIQPNK